MLRTKVGYGDARIEMQHVVTSEAQPPHAKTFDVQRAGQLDRGRHPEKPENNCRGTVAQETATTLANVTLVLTNTRTAPKSNFTHLHKSGNPSIRHHATIFFALGKCTPDTWEDNFAVQP